MVEKLNSNQVLKSLELDQLLNEQGYVVVPFLDKNAIEELKQFFFNNHPEPIPGFYATAHSSDIPFRNKMNDKIKSVFQSSIDSYFVNCEALGGSFVVKTKSQTERLHPHQDWNIVDENKYRSFNIWVPLVDLSEKNGAICVLPESHLWGLNYRGPNIPDKRADQLEKFWGEMKTLHMQAGEALIYDHRLYHASFPNKTDKYRLASVFGIKPKTAEMYYYYGTEKSIDVYESSIDFFMNGDIQNGPKELKKIKQITLKSLKEKSVVNSPPAASLLGKLKRLFQLT